MTRDSATFKVPPAGLAPTVAPGLGWLLPLAEEGLLCSATK